jgi:geranylgeranyl pyrophosphate synthase
MSGFDEFIAGVRDDVDEALDRLLPSADVEPAGLHAAIRWSVFAGGKRVRPALVLAAGETFGAHRTDLIDTAAAVEMIHTYSLIHDDLPAMDDDDLRRGKPSCHRQFGEATAILAGDVLQTLAFAAVAEDGKLSAETRLRVISTLVRAAGTPEGMVAGQQLDLDGEGANLAIAEIERIHRLKTGALITAAATAGALIGGATEAEQIAIMKYSSELGLLFQIKDDLLDATAATEKLGKTAGKDAAAAKATYVGHYGLEGGRNLVEKNLGLALAALDPLQRDTSRLRELAQATAVRTR